MHGLPPAAVVGLIAVEEGCDLPAAALHLLCGQALETGGRGARTGVELVDEERRKLVLPDQSKRLGKVRCGLCGESTDDISCYSDAGDPAIECEVCWCGVLCWSGVKVRCDGEVSW